MDNMQTTLFSIEHNQIRTLNDIQLTRLLKMLLHLEAFRHGITQRSVDVSLNITVPDGGEDGRIKWDGTPDETGSDTRSTPATSRIVKGTFRSTTGCCTLLSITIRVVTRL